MIEPMKLVEAIAETWDNLPDCVGEDWPMFEAKLLVLLRDLQTDECDSITTIERILSLLRKYPDVKSLVNSYAAEQERQWGSFHEQDSKTFRSAVHYGIPRSDKTWRGLKSDQAEEDCFKSYKRYITIPVFYATDREETRNEVPSKIYSGTRGSDLQFGIAEISIPDDHRMGHLEKPSFWKLQFRKDPRRHIVLLGIEKLDINEFVRRSNNRITNSDNKDALIFIHGYKTTFADATRRTAQITYDLDFKGLPILYSWPSEGKLLSYTIDEGNILWTRPHFKHFVQLVLRELRAETVHIIAHSMGNRVLAEMLVDLDASSVASGDAKIRHIIFAAPDIDKDTFQDLAARFSSNVERYTLYSSTKDLPLEASKAVHRYQRAGDSEPEVTIVESIDTIDASNVDASLLGHAYYGENRSVITDIYHLIKHGLPPNERNLALCWEGDKQYWEFRR